jgi:predicted CXXCH cytochrome family protein
MLLLQKETAGVAMNKRKNTQTTQCTQFTQLKQFKPSTPCSPSSPCTPCSLSSVLLCALLFFLIFSSVAFAGGDLKANVPGLCYQCHIKMKDKLSDPVVHAPFKEGKCNACHNSHAGDMKGLIKENINKLCLGCHEKIKTALKNKYVHYVIKRGLCTDCHYAHSGSIKSLLVKEQKDLCWICHESLQEQFKKTAVHKPFKNGECASCHEPHASATQNQLIDSPEKICVKCHSVKCTIKGVSIKQATEKMKCTSCHSGHASDSKALLGPYGHKAFLDENCEQCHIPFAEGAKISVKMQITALCISCHKKDNPVIKSNDKHMIKEKGDCLMCHNQHASQQKNLTAKETEVCVSCHESTEKKTLLMEKALKNIRCTPVKDRKCFQCHIPPHSENKLYLKSDEIISCARCHEGQHKVTHPLGKDTKDPRDGKPLTCITCHSMHSSKAEFMLYFDRKRQLCIQCHRR